MTKGLAIVAVCLAILAGLDQEFFAGWYTDQVLQMVRQIGYSFGRLRRRGVAANLAPAGR